MSFGKSDESDSVEFMSKDELLFLDDSKVLASDKSNPLKFKDPINVSDLRNKGQMSFELDTMSDDLESLDMLEDEGSNLIDHDINHYEDEYIGHTKYEHLLNSFTPDEKLGNFDEEDAKNFTISLTPDDKIKKMIIREGKGVQVPADGKVWYHYIAYAEGKEEYFDSSVHRGSPQSLNFSSDLAVVAYGTAAKSMRVGEVAKFWAHYDYAFGKIGVPPRIPPEADIVFTIEMLNFLGPKDLKSVYHMNQYERSELPFEDIIGAGKEMQRAGNGFYKKQDYKNAVKRYRKGIDILENYSTLVKNENEERLEVLGTLFHNLTQCYIKMDQPRKACTAARYGLRIEDHHISFKLFYRFAQAKEMFKDYEVSLKLVERALESLSKSKISETEKTKAFKEIEDYKKKLDKLYKESELKEKDMFKKMLSG